MGDSERQEFQRKLALAKLSLAFTFVSLLATLAFGVRAWAGLPERVQALEKKAEKQSDILMEIRSSLSRIEGRLEQQ